MAQLSIATAHEELPSGHTRVDAACHSSLSLPSIHRPVPIYTPLVGYRRGVIKTLWLVIPGYGWATRSAPFKYP
jgi:hypothetical protein